MDAAPFLKWAGGKTQLLNRILPSLPTKMKTYYEPFIGGGAVFFALAREGRFKRAVLADQNPNLVEAYTVIRDDVNSLMEALSVHVEYATDSEYFYELRAVDQETLSPVLRVARMLYLNKTCFNGLYRLNRKGQFNVPFGKYKNPKVLNAPRLLACSEALQNAEIIHSDFESSVRRAKTGDVVYFDPPYVPLSKTSSFTSYAATPFELSDHARLARVFRDCWRRGAHAVLSNSDCDETRHLYKAFRFESVAATRAINRDASKRGAVSELLVTGLKRAPARKVATRKTAARTKRVRPA